MILAFANIVNIINICRSRQLSFLALAKKFHANALLENAVQATSYTIVLFKTPELFFQIINLKQYCVN